MTGSLPPVAILAGGLGTRLGPEFAQSPKALVEVAGRPFVIHQLERLRNGGVSRVVLCLGHLGNQIIDTLGDGRAMGLDVEYSYDGARLLGTGGALRRALPLLGDEFFVLYGDSYLEIDYELAYRTFRRSGRLALMTVFRNRSAGDVSNVLYRGDAIVRYDKGAPTADMEHIDYGLGLLTRAALVAVPEGVVYDLADLYRDLSERQQLAALEVTHRFYEIGSISGLLDTRRYLEAQRDTTFQ